MALIPTGRLFRLLSVVSWLEAASTIGIAARSIPRTGAVRVEKLVGNGDFSGKCPSQRFYRSFRGFEFRFVVHRLRHATRIA
jgi:hypothetical protein